MNNAVTIQLTIKASLHYFYYALCPGGEIGRHARFRFWCRKVCRFESYPGHFLFFLYMSSLLPAAIAIILNEDETQVLLVKRRDVMVWVLPGGGIEPHETAEEALIREIEEETGFKVRILRQCAEYLPLNRLASQTSVFICRIESGQMQITNETSNIQFYPVKKLPEFFFYPHAIWLKEALTHKALIQRPLREISYLALLKYIFCHPWQVLRFAWTRFIKRGE